MTVIVLILCLLQNDGVTQTLSRTMPSMEECEAAGEFARASVVGDPRVIDAGSICIVNRFSEAARPRT